MHSQASTSDQHHVWVGTPLKVQLDVCIESAQAACFESRAQLGEA